MTTLEKKIEELKAKTKELQLKKKAQERAKQRKKKLEREKALFNTFKTCLARLNNDEKLLLEIIEKHLNNKQ